MYITLNCHKFDTANETKHWVPPCNFTCMYTFAIKFDFRQLQRLRLSATKSDTAKIQDRGITSHYTQDIRAFCIISHLIKLNFRSETLNINRHLLYFGLLAHCITTLYYISYYVLGFLFSVYFPFTSNIFSTLHNYMSFTSVSTTLSLSNKHSQALNQARNFRMSS